MEFTYMFYGYYDNFDLHIESVSYSVPLAYVMVTGAYVIISAILMLAR